MCTPPGENISVKGKVILATRGECSFIDKAEAVVAAGLGDAGALIVVNNETSLFHMGASPRCDLCFDLWGGTLNPHRKPEITPLSTRPRCPFDGPER